MNFHHAPSCVLVTGKKGSGKTTYWLSRCVAHRARWKFYFDPGQEAARKLNLPVVTDAPGIVAAVAACRPVCFDSSRHFPGDRREGFAWFSRQVMALSKSLRGVKLLACDEFQSVQRTGDDGLPPALKEITDEGRREEIDCIFAAQRLGEVNHAIRGSLTELVTFKHTDPLALDWLQNAAGGMGCPFDRAAVSALPTPGSWFLFRDDGYTAKHLRAGKPKPARA